MKLLFSVSVVVCLFISMLGTTLAYHSRATLPQSKSPTPAPSHARFDKLLKAHVSNNGLVDYKGFAGDKGELSTYLDWLSKHPPASNWSKDEKLAYWINAYNAYTIQLILDHYPVKSIKDIGSKLKIPFVNTPWDIKFIRISGETYNLNNLEHGIIRKQFAEPRIHFALVCAAKSCPRLRNEAYVAGRLNAQLDDQATEFINNPTKNSITSRQASLSKIFDWYGEDFKRMKNMTVEQVINKYSITKIADGTRISYQTYDWRLNEQ